VSLADRVWSISGMTVMGKTEVLGEILNSSQDLTIYHCINVKQQ